MEKIRMKILRGIALACLTVMALLFFFTSHGIALTLQPWTTAETNLFATSREQEGAGWIDNTLILYYPGGTAAPGQSQTTSWGVDNFMPADTIGVSFGVSRSTEIGNTHVKIRGKTIQSMTSHQSIYYIEQFIENSRPGYGGPQTTDFFGNINRPWGMEFIYDIPETNENGITTVNFFFIQDIMEAPVSYFAFEGQNVDGGIPQAGTTTFSDVSWIMDDGTIPFPFPDPTQPSSDPNNPVPEPSTILLVATGLIGLVGFRKKFKK